MAETTTGAMLSVQNASIPMGEGEGQPTVPEDLGKQTAHLLLEEIYQVQVFMLQYRHSVTVLKSI